MSPDTAPASGGRSSNARAAGVPATCWISAAREERIISVTWWAASARAAASRRRSTSASSACPRGSGASRPIRATPRIRAASSRISVAIAASGSVSVVS